MVDTFEGVFVDAQAAIDITPPATMPEDPGPFDGAVTDPAPKLTIRADTRPIYLPPAEAPVFPWGWVVGVGLFGVAVIVLFVYGASL